MVNGPCFWAYDRGATYGSGHLEMTLNVFSGARNRCTCTFFQHLSRQTQVFENSGKIVFLCELQTRYPG